MQGSSDSQDAGLALLAESVLVGLSVALRAAAGDVRESWASLIAMA